MTRHPMRRPEVEVAAAADGFLARLPASSAVTWLNRTGYLVLELCTGANDVESIAAAIGRAYDLPVAPLAAVRETVAELVTAGLVTPGDVETPPHATLHIALWAPTDSVPTDVVAATQSILDGLRSAGIPTTITIDRDRNLRSARNGAANRVLQGNDATHVLFLDARSETVVAVRDCELPRLIASAHEVIGIPVASRTIAWERARRASAEVPGLTDREVEAYATNFDVSFTTLPSSADLATGFIEGYHCNSGALLVQRSGLERIAGSAPANHHRGLLSHGIVTMTDGWGFFDPGFSHESIDIDEDLAFCERIRAAGGRLVIALTSDFRTSINVGQRLTASTE